MKTPLDQGIQRWIAPVLSDAGFTRKGRKFSIEGAGGSTGEIEVVRSAQGRHEAEFQVDPFVSPKIWAEYQLRMYGTKRAHLWYGQSPELLPQTAQRVPRCHRPTRSGATCPPRGERSVS